jgi:hypothetical protein
VRLTIARQSCNLASEKFELQAQQLFVFLFLARRLAFAPFAKLARQLLELPAHLGYRLGNLVLIWIAATFGFGPIPQIVSEASEFATQLADFVRKLEFACIFSIDLPAIVAVAVAAPLQALEIASEQFELAPSAFPWWPKPVFLRHRWLSSLG